MTRYWVHAFFAPLFLFISPAIWALTPPADQALSHDRSKTLHNNQVVQAQLAADADQKIESSLTLANASEIVPDKKITGLDLLKNKRLAVEFNQVALGTVIVFLSAKCPCSNSYVSILTELAEKYQKSGKFQFVGIHSNLDEEPPQAVEYFKSKDLSFPVLEDGSLRVADFYKAYKTPHAFIVSPKGKILFQGGVGSQNIFQVGKTKNFLAAAIENLAEGKEVEQNEVRTLGCIIKRPENTVLRKPDVG